MDRNRKAKFDFGPVYFAVKCYPCTYSTKFSSNIFFLKIGIIILYILKRSSYLRNESWKPECVGSCNMDWRILVFYLEPEVRDKIY
jgi:hypothetical protein